MRSECHCHFVLDGVDFRQSLALHRDGKDQVILQQTLAAYRDAGIYRLRDGGDRDGACLRAKALAPEYGMDLRTPAFAIHKNGYYGAMVGRDFDTMDDYRALVQEAGRLGADFIKIMVSGIVDFQRYGVLSCDSLPPSLVRSMVSIAHDAGFRVMAHANGEGVRTALLCGVDSVEHGYYSPPECAVLFAQTGAIFVPTLVTCSNLIGSGRYPDDILRRIHADHAAFTARCLRCGALVASGSDAGAWKVPHVQGLSDELHALTSLGADDKEVEKANDILFSRFRRGSC